MTKSYDIYTDLYLCYMNVIYVYMMLKIHADISICICMYDLINTCTYEHSGSLMLKVQRLADAGHCPAVRLTASGPAQSTAEHAAATFV